MADRCVTVMKNSVCCSKQGSVITTVSSLGRLQKLNNAAGASFYSSSLFPIKAAVLPNYFYAKITVHIHTFISNSRPSFQQPIRLSLSVADSVTFMCKVTTTKLMALPQDGLTHKCVYLYIYLFFQWVACRHLLISTKHKV